MNPDDLRSRLATAYPDVPPPPDLAARAERKAAGIRRRRLVLAAGAVAVLLAVPVAVTGLRDDRALPPAGVVPVGDPCRPPDSLPGQPLGTSAEDAAAWGYRGDPALRETAERVGHLHNDAPTVVPLYAARVAPENWLLVVYAARVTTDWHVFAVWAPQGVQASSVYVVDAAIGKLPELRPDAAISLLLPTPRQPEPPPEWVSANFRVNTLIVLAPPGSSRIDYRGCRLGAPFDVTGDGDVLVRDVGLLDAQGVLAVRTADGAAGYSGPAADMPVFSSWPEVMMPPPDPIPVPPGTRLVARSVGQGYSVTGGLASEGALRPGESHGDASILVRCRAGQPAEVRIVEVPTSARSLGTVPCDDAVHTVAEGIDVPRNVTVGPAGAPGGAGSDQPSMAYQLVVVVPT